MKSSWILLPLAAVVLAGCRSPEARITNPKAPGPAVGNVVGSGVGTLAGNVAGAVVGVGEGAAAAASQPFKYDPTKRIICHWHEEKTPDGRVILVPEYYLVDAHGRILRRWSEEELR